MSLFLNNISLPLKPFMLEVDVEIHGRITALFGPSGAGKTSLLDLIAGLRHARSAFIKLDDEVLTDVSGNFCVPTSRRGIGYVPQDLALFPHLSVKQNVSYGHKDSAGSNPLFSLDRVVEILEIGPLLARGIAELSGGEKQRVALARALLASPRLLLLDEPLASLDLKLKQRIIPYLARIRDEFRLPMLYVTHDRYETIALADEMIVMAGGKVIQSGSVQQIFNRPSGSASDLFAVETVLAGKIMKTSDDLVTVSVGSATLAAVAENLSPDLINVNVCIRAHDVIIIKGGDNPSSARNHLPGTVQSVTSEGPLTRAEVDCGFTLAVLLTRQSATDLALKPGDRIIALIKAPHVRLISR